MRAAAAVQLHNELNSTLVRLLLESELALRNVVAPAFGLRDRLWFEVQGVGVRV